MKEAPDKISAHDQAILDSWAVKKEVDTRSAYEKRKAWTQAALDTGDEMEAASHLLALFEMVYAEPIPSEILEGFEKAAKILGKEHPVIVAKRDYLKKNPQFLPKNK